MDTGDPALRERLTGLQLQRDELTRELSVQQKQLEDGTPALTPAKIKAVGSLLRDKPFDGPSSEIRIAGSKSALARCASTELGDAAPAVLSFVKSGASFESKTTKRSI